MHHDSQAQPTAGAATQRADREPGIPDEIDQMQLQALAADISARLRRVCPNLSDREFADLVIDIASVRIRYDQRAYGVVRRAARTANDD